MGDISRSRTSSFDSITNEVPSALHDVDSVPPSRSGTPCPTSLAASVAGGGTLDGNTSVKIIPPAADSNAQLKLDIRAHSAAVREAHTQAIAQQQYCGNKANEAEAAWKATPLYHFDDRLKLYYASAKAHIKFNASTNLLRLEKMHVDYLEAVGKSGLSPEEQHAAYSKFKEALSDAQQKRAHADCLEESAVGSSSRIKKFYASRDAAAKTEAARAERNLQALLNEVQKPHAESRHAIAQLLEYRRVRWNELNHPNFKDSPADKELRNEIQILQSFQTSGGLNSLSSEDAQKLNTLYADASQKYKAYKQERGKDYNNPSLRQDAGTVEVSKESGETWDIFKEADTAVMNEIRRLRDLHSLRNNLSSDIAYRDKTLNALAVDLKALSDDKTNMLKRLSLIMSKKLVSEFLESNRLHSLTSEEINQLNNLFEQKQEKYASLQTLRNSPLIGHEDATPLTTSENLPQAEALFQQADDALMAKINKLLFSGTPKPSAPSPPIPSKDIPLTSSATAAAVPLPNNNPPELQSTLDDLRTSYLAFRRKSGKDTIPITQFIALLESDTPVAFISPAELQSLESIILNFKNSETVLDNLYTSSSLSETEIQTAVNNLRLADEALINELKKFASSTQDLAALRVFAANYQQTILTAITRLSPDSDVTATEKKTDLDNQAENLTILLRILDDPKTPTETLKSLRSLVDQMKAIEEKNLELAEARKTSSPAEEILKASHKLQNDFLAELQKIVSSF